MHDFSLWLRASLNLANINQVRSHTGKLILFICYYVYHLRIKNTKLCGGDCTPCKNDIFVIFMHYNSDTSNL